jgi:tight adherence protein B
MILTLITVFAAVFAVVWLVAASASSGQRRSQRQILSRLESVSMAARRRPEEESLSLLREEGLSSLPFLDRWLKRLDLFPTLTKILLQSQVPWTLIDLLAGCLIIGCTVAAVVYWRTHAALFSLAFGIAAAAIPVLYLFYRRSQRFAALEKQLPEGLDLIVRALRAGHGLISGIEMVANELPKPLGEEFKKTFDEQNYGLELREALLNLAERVPLHDVRIIVTAIMIQRDTGGNLAEVLAKTSHVIRERYRLKRQIRVHTAQGRLTGWILALLPLILGCLLFIARPDFISVLWQNPTGLKMLYAACVMTLLGALAIRKIIQIRV